MRLRPQILALIGSIWLIIVSLLFGCAYYDKAQAIRTEAAEPRGLFAPPPTADRASTVGVAAERPLARLAADKGTDSAVPVSQRMLIYTGRLGMAVADIEASVQATRRLADEVGGYMLTMSANSITIRVPAKQFFPVLERLKALGQTLSKNISAEDVTDEYTDLQLRLKNAEALRDRLVAILEKAANVKDTLEVERELNRVREEIERIKGRIAQLDKLIAFSTIEVSFTQAQDQPAKIRRPETPFPWLDRLGVETVLGIRG